MTKNKILEYLSEHKEEFQQKYNVKKIGLFGSYARGEEHSDSDIDILVDMPSSFDNYFDLKYQLEDKFQKSIDLGKENTIRPYLKKRILEETIYV